MPKLHMIDERGLNPTAKLDSYPITYRVKPSLSDAGYVHNIFNPRKRAVLRPMINNATGENIANTVQIHKFTP